ncbi:MAG: hypothetical protein FWE46_05540 [Coriobacteriia bacterium]|nr:hypothetical protein [Coriobacteriia bacterium]
MAARKGTHIEDRARIEGSTFIFIVLAAGAVMCALLFVGIGGYYLVRALLG